MALIRVAQYSSTPTVVGDYQAQNAHLQAFTSQLMTQQFILDAGTAQPIIKQGCYVSHGGSLYVADADTAITGSPSDGSVYIRVSGTTTLTVEFVTDISGYAWNPVYTALTSGSYTLLPYLIVKASTVWTRYNFNPNNQAFGNAIIDGHNIDSELDTLNSRVNQAVNTTSSPTFVSVNTGQGANELFAMNQNVRTTDIPTFLGIITTYGPNQPKDNNWVSMPSGVGIGGFSYAVDSTSTRDAYPSITIGSGGTWVYIASSPKGDDYINTIKVGRIAGGSSVQGRYAATTDFVASLNVIAWRIS